MGNSGTPSWNLPPPPTPTASGPVLSNSALGAVEARPGGMEVVKLKHSRKPNALKKSKLNL